MKKIIKIVLISFVSLFVVLVIGIYALYVDLFPMAEKLDYPEYSSIESITISKKGEQIYLSEEEYELLYNYIRTAKPTRIFSGNETPDVSPFYEVSVDGNKCGYIFEKNGNYYYEIPYQGIYKFRIK